MTRPESASSNPTYTERLAKIAGLPDDEKWAAVRELTAALYTEPPTPEWTRLPAGIGTDEIIDVPFTQSEAAAILPAQLAYEALMVEAGRTSGAAREFMIQTSFFPRHTGSLQDRHRAVWGVMSASLAAHDAMTAYANTAWEPDEEQTPLFQTIIDLPDSLVEHEPPAIAA